VLETSVDLITAGKKLRAGRSANWLDVVVLQAHAGGGNGVNVRRFDDILKWAKDKWMIFT